MKCEIILGGVSPVWHNFAMTKLAEWYLEWLRKEHPEIYYGNKKECSAQTTNQRTTFPGKTKKYKKASLQK